MRQLLAMVAPSIHYIYDSTCACPYICIYMFNRVGEEGGSTGQGVTIDKVISCSMPSRRSWTQRSLELPWPGLAKLLPSILLSLSSFFISLFILLPRNVSSMCSYELLIGHRVRCAWRLVHRLSNIDWQCTWKGFDFIRLSLSYAISELCWLPRLQGLCACRT